MASPRTPPGNVYSSDILNPNDTFFMPSMASTSTATIWPPTKFNSMPAHPNPAIETLNQFSLYPSETYARPGPAESLDVNIDYHSDWTAADGMPVWSADQLVRECARFPLGPSDLPPSSIGRMPLVGPEFSNLTPSNDVFTGGSWSQTIGDYPTCHVFAPELTGPLENAAALVWDIEALDRQSVWQCQHNNFKSNTFPAHRACEWSENGMPCNETYPSGDVSDLKHAIAQHLHRAHGLISPSGKSTLRCMWVGCYRELKTESVVRHVLTVHLHATIACEGCGTAFARLDSLQRHMRNSCGARKR